MNAEQIYSVLVSAKIHSDSFHTGFESPTKIGNDQLEAYKKNLHRICQAYTAISNAIKKSKYETEDQLIQKLYDKAKLRPELCCIAYGALTIKYDQSHSTVRIGDIITAILYNQIDHDSHFSTKVVNKRIKYLSELVKEKISDNIYNQTINYFAPVPINNPSSTSRATHMYLEMNNESV